MHLWANRINNIISKTMQPIKLTSNHILLTILFFYSTFVPRCVELWLSHKHFKYILFKLNNMRSFFCPLSFVVHYFFVVGVSFSFFEFIFNLFQWFQLKQSAWWIFFSPVFQVLRLCHQHLYAITNITRKINLHIPIPILYWRHVLLMTMPKTITTYSTQQL